MEAAPGPRVRGLTRSLQCHQCAIVCHFCGTGRALFRHLTYHLSQMALLHDAEVRNRIVARLNALRPDTRARWGKMSVDQMLWHVGEAMEFSLSDPPHAPVMLKFLQPVLKWVVITLPWMKGAPTRRDWVARTNYDFEAQRQRVLALIDVVAARRLDASWPNSPTLGRMTGRNVSRLHAKHLIHHLDQFGV